MPLSHASRRVHRKRFSSLKKVPRRRARVLWHFYRGIHPTHDVGRAHCTGLPRELATAFEQHQGRYAADAESRAHAWRRFRVELGETHPRLQLRRGLLERRRHHLAGAAPRSPKFHEHRIVVAHKKKKKQTKQKHSGMAREQGAMTLSAIG